MMGFLYYVNFNDNDCIFLSMLDVSVDIAKPYEWNVFANLANESRGQANVGDGLEYPGVPTDRCKPVVDSF